VAVAKEMLEAAAPMAMSSVAERSGFGSEESLRRHFRRIVQTSPAAYRRKFGASSARPQRRPVR